MITTINPYPNIAPPPGATFVDDWRKERGMTACEPGREFGFAVLLGNRAVNNWHYKFTPNGGGTDVTSRSRYPFRLC